MSTDIRDVVIMLSDDKNKARLAIVDRGPGGDKPLAWHDFDAAALANLIVHLGNIRAQMADEVPREMDPGMMRLDGTQVNPPTVVGNEGPMSKRFVIGLRHPGYGWLGFGWNESNGKVVTAMMMNEVMRLGSLPRGIIRPPPGVI